MTFKRGRKKSVESEEDEVMAKVMAAASKMDGNLECNDYTLEPQKEPEPQLSEHHARLETAYLRMGITHEQVQAFPPITDAFADLGGVPAVIGYLRSSTEKGAKDLVRIYDSFPREITRNMIPFEAYCVAANLTKKKVFQILMGEVCEHSDAVSTLLAAKSQPAVVQKTIKVALSDDFGASEARSTLHKHRGFLPTPKTQQVTIHGSVHQDNRQDNSKNILIPLSDLAIGTGKIGRATDRFNTARVTRSESTDAEIPENTQEYIEGYE